jgi:hypothetical protein
VSEGYGPPSLTLQARESFALLAAAAPGSDAVRDKLHDILSRSEFGAPQQPWWADLVRRFFEWLGNLYDTAPILFWLLFVLLAGLLLLLLGHLVWTVRRVLTAGGRSGRRDNTAAERRQRSLACRAEAARLASAGEYTEAIRYLFLSLLYLFDESGRVLFQRALTNQEYLGLFAARPQVQADLRTFVAVLDDHWYGERRTDEVTYHQCQALFDEMERLAAGQA